MTDRKSYYVACQMAPIAMSAKVTFVVSDLSNTQTSGNLVHINYSVFTHELERTCGL